MVTATQQQQHASILHTHDLVGCNKTPTLVYFFFFRDDPVYQGTSFKIDEGTLTCRMNVFFGLHLKKRESSSSSSVFVC
jgi:hypothetical protein